MRAKFFDLEGNNRFFRIGDSFGHGLYAWSHVYMLPDSKTVIKIYNDGAGECFRIDYETFMFLKSYSNPHLLKLIV